LVSSAGNQARFQPGFRYWQPAPPNHGEDEVVKEAVDAFMYWCKLNLKANFESGSSYFGFKRLV
jgi:hypothetical protein